VIIQRSNGDVFFSNSLIQNIFYNFENPVIDLLVNSDTLKTAKLIPNINNIIEFSYEKKREKGYKYLINLFINTYKKYDYSINLTSSDRSVLLSIFSGRKSISVVDIEFRKSWWKKLFLTHHYLPAKNKHILEEILFPLSFLNLHYLKRLHQLIDAKIPSSLEKKLPTEKFLIFHPCAQYEYKVLPLKLRNQLLEKLSKLDIPIVITGSSSSLDNAIKDSIPDFKNLFNIIGETTLSDFVSLSKLSLGYIGMDTLNMHIAASQDKPIFAIFGPTNIYKWAPWSNKLEKNMFLNKPFQKHEKIRVFQANLPCVACGKAGCQDLHQMSECLNYIDIDKIVNEVKNAFKINN